MNAWDALALDDELDCDALCAALALVDESAVKHEQLGDAFATSATDLGVIPAEAYLPVTGGFGVHSTPTADMPVPMAVPINAAADAADTRVTCRNGKSNACAGSVNRSRTRKREELLYLRSAVGELEERLQVLQARAAQQDAMTQRCAVGAKDSAAAGDDPVMAAAWEEVATRQLEQRQRAEAENGQLRRMLQDQIQVGRSLERLLKKRSNFELLDSMANHNKRIRRRSISSSWSKTEIFDELSAEIPALFVDTAKMFPDPPLKHGEKAFRDIQVKQDPETGMLVDVVESRVFPFDFDTTAMEIWRIFLLHPTSPEPMHGDDAHVTEHTIKVRFTVSVQLPRTEGEMVVQLVAQRFVEAERIVIVWCAQTTPANMSDDSLDGVYMRHKGWNIVERVPPQHLGCPRTVATLSRSHSMAIPALYDDVEDSKESKRKVGTLTNFMLSSMDLQLDSRHQILENRLLARKTTPEKT